MVLTATPCPVATGSWFEACSTEWLIPALALVLPSVQALSLPDA